MEALHSLEADRVIVRPWATKLGRVGAGVSAKRVASVKKRTRAC
jgi:hypothetical protein